ncbi:malonate--CoA ligase [Algihabitans albus]|uniref:malonate--CoA ligase n=1 Tax=Algihabitans albus TaxID=2164067 RepID=UPI000E5C621A|nr:malonyl-CoA synthase [Algihabitans albus]
MSENLYDLLAENFPKDRTKPVMQLEDGRLLSYADLETQAGRYARLLSELGVKPGDRVAVQTDKSANAVFLYLGVMKMGAVYLPLNVGYTGAEIAYFLGDATPALVVCRPESEAVLREIAEKSGVSHVHTMDAQGGGSLTEAAAGLEPLAESHPAAAAELAAILYTSGTTGRSKGAMLTHGNLSSNALALKEIWGFRPGDRLLHMLPIFHVHGLFVAINTTLANGSEMVFLPKFDAERAIQLLPSCSVMMGVPTFYVRLLAEVGFTKEVASGVRLFVSGSAPLLEETFEAFEQRTGQRILERYGMTECGMITSNPYSETEERPRRAGTVGFPLPEVEVRVADEDGRQLGAEEIGVLEVKGPNVFKGYWKMPEKTSEEFRADGFFITGDMSKIDAKGCVHIVGRAKDLVISGGYNVYPKEIELVIDALPGVAESAVVGLPHPDFGEAVAAVVKRCGEIAEDAIIEACAKDLARFKVPKRVFFVEDLPRNTMGKVQKAELRQAYGETFGTA